MIANITHFNFFFRSDWKLDISWLKTKTTIPIGFQYRTLLQLCYRASGYVLPYVNKTKAIFRRAILLSFEQILMIENVTKKSLC